VKSGFFSNQIVQLVPWLISSVLSVSLVSLSKTFSHFFTQKPIQQGKELLGFIKDGQKVPFFSQLAL